MLTWSAILVRVLIVVAIATTASATHAQIVPPRCGDNVVNDVTEECDGTDAAACPAQCLGDCRCPLNHFQCYEVRRQPFDKVRHNADDRFAPGVVTRKLIKRFCLPADKNGEDPSASSAPQNLTGYQIDQDPKPGKVSNVQFTDQFGTLVADLTRPELLLVPSARSILGAPPPLKHPTDHFKCYRLRRALKQVKGLDVVDSFNTLKVDLKRPFRLCVPVDKDGEGIIDPSQFLTCYQTHTDPSRSPFTSAFFTTDQFGAHRLELTRTREFCAPARLDSAPSTCTITVSRDLPRWTHPLTEWPPIAQCRRSPRHVFGKQRPISIQVTRDDVSKPSIDVVVKSPSTDGSIAITLDLVGGVYRNRTPDEDLYLLDETKDTATGDFIHVREEELLIFEVDGQPACQVQRLVDRGEAAAATPKDEAVPGHTNAMEDGFVAAATAFMDGTAGFDALTTPWFDVGRKFRAPCSDPYGPFFLAAGSNDPDDKQADMLHVGGHSHASGSLSGGDAAAPNKSCEHFIPEHTGLFRKSQTDPTPYPTPVYFTDPEKWYWGATKETLPTFAILAPWDADVDWAMLYSCLSLNDTAFDTGSHKFAVTPVPAPTAPLPTPTFVHEGIKDVTGSQRPWQRWTAAFKGARPLHGIMGFKGLGSTSTSIKGVIEKWTALVKGGKDLAQAWLQVTHENGNAGAVVFVPRNLPDTIDTMERDPCPGDVVTYKASGQTDVNKKKLVKGKFKEVGTRPIDPEFPIETIYTVFFGGSPGGTLAGGQCTVWAGLPATGGSFPRLTIERGETPSVGSPFVLDADDVYAFDLNAPPSLAENTVTNAQAEQALRDSLAAGFTTVPADLATFGIFPGIVQTDSLSYESSYEVVLEQRYLGLTIFDSNVYGLLAPDGAVDLAKAVFYDSTVLGASMPLLSATDAAEIAAGDLLANHSAVPCRLTDMQAFYGYPQPAGFGQSEVRPVWGVEFNLGEAIYTIDGVDGSVLEAEVAN